ncbi:MAG TPA: hypothetical protein VGR45_15525 [Stellaceae bacterium]|nr:hypothetical protein [Stellaceae bacterium]
MPIPAQRRNDRAAPSIGRKHGFANSGNTLLRIQSTLAEPVFEAAYDDKRETLRRRLPNSA